MSTPTKPGQRCRVVGGRTPFNGEGASPNHGKIVTTVFLHAEKAGIEQENVWRCQSSDVLQTYYGAGHAADFLECWLEVQPEDTVEPPALRREVDA
ncbi:MAG: hypothetical protein Q8K24_08925 [Hydrogenophaga sp.]|nr:hypothetical protein [Hydrogenophaga sp.]